MKMKKIKMKLKDFLGIINKEHLEKSKAGFIIPVNMKHPEFNLSESMISGEVIIDTSKYTIYDKEVYHKYGIDVCYNEYDKVNVIETDEYRYAYDKNHNIYVLIC